MPTLFLRNGFTYLQLVSFELVRLKFFTVMLLLSCSRLVFYAHSLVRVNLKIDDFFFLLAVCMMT